MAVEVNVKSLFQDFNHSKFVVYVCLLIFSLLFALRLDKDITWSFWVVFLPIWIWKVLVVMGAIVGSYVWWNNPQCRMEADSYVQYKAMVIYTGLHLLLLMFELLACDKLENKRSQVLWILVFIPLIFMSILSIGICVWAVKHDRTFELELFCSVNILQFIFLALKLDGFITWSWVLVFIPIWVVMCLALIGVLYAIILAILAHLSVILLTPERRADTVCSAIGYTCFVVPLLVFQVLLSYKEDGVKDCTYIAVTLPLLLSIMTLITMAFGSKGGNQWWFGLRKDFCPWLLGVCPLLQEYGNISYKVQTGSETNEPRDPEPPPLRKHVVMPARKGGSLDDSRTVVPMMAIDVPD